MIFNFILILVFLAPFFGVFVNNTKAHTGYVHERFIDYAFDILDNDKDLVDANGKSLYPGMRDFVRELFTNNYLDRIDEGSVYQDSEALLQVNHAWDPILERGMMGLAEGALPRAILYFNEATEIYKTGDKNNAYRKLGEALHMVQDVTVPYHAISTIGMSGLNWGEYTIDVLEDLVDAHELNLAQGWTGKHVEFEAYCKDVLNDLASTPSQLPTHLSPSQYMSPTRYDYSKETQLPGGSYGHVYNWFGYHAGSWVQYAANYGRMRYDDVDTYTPTYYADGSVDTYPTQWRTPAEEIIEKAIELTASFIFYFWNSVTDEYDSDGDTIPDAPLDFDNDGLIGEEEYYYTDFPIVGGWCYNYHYTNYGNYDSDFDFIPDGRETEIECDALMVDTDGDGISDGSEDYDDDGLLNFLEIDEGTDPTDSDTDGDSFFDGEEVYGVYAPTHPYAWGNGKIYGLNPLSWDTDGDFIGDWFEISGQIGVEHPYANAEGILFTDPTEIDSDFDTLADPEEIMFYFTDPNNPDSDNDNIGDEEEVDTGNDGYITDPNNIDSDGDGIDDFTEIVIGTDPNVPDTDGDSYSDFDEINIYGTDPNNPEDNPYVSYIPEYVPSFRALSNNINKLTFSWSQPSNYISGWKYKVKRWTGSSWQKIYEGTSRVFNYYPPSATTFYSYRIYCYNGNNQPGVYSSWAGKVKSSGGGGGGGPMLYDNTVIGSLSDDGLIKTNIFLTILPVVNLIIISVVFANYRKKKHEMI